MERYGCFGRGHPWHRSELLLVQHIHSVLRLELQQLELSPLQAKVEEDGSSLQTTGPRHQQRLFGRFNRRPEDAEVLTFLRSDGKPQLLVVQ